MKHNQRHQGDGFTARGTFFHVLPLSHNALNPKYAIEYINWPCVMSLTPQYFGASFPLNSIF
jgi:hypothetical protein